MCNNLGWRTVQCTLCSELLEKPACLKVENRLVWIKQAACYLFSFSFLYSCFLLYLIKFSWCRIKWIRNEILRCLIYWYIHFITFKYFQRGGSRYKIKNHLTVKRISIVLEVMRYFGLLYFCKSIKIVESAISCLFLQRFRIFQWQTTGRCYYLLYILFRLTFVVDIDDFFGANLRNNSWDTSIPLLLTRATWTRFDDIFAFIALTMANANPPWCQSLIGGSLTATFTFKCPKQISTVANWSIPLLTILVILTEVESCN